MASLMEEIADALARDVLRAMEQIGDENLVTEVGRVIGSSSTTTQEAFMTAVRIRMSEQRARRLLAEKVGADWPLEPGATGSAKVPALTLLGQAPVGAAMAPASPSPRIAAGSAARSSVPDPLDDPSLEIADDPESRDVATIESPSAPSDFESAVEADIFHPLEDGTVEPLDPSRVRPKIPAPPPQVKPAPSAPAPRSLEAALALATSLPRKVVAPVEPTTPVVNPYADIEMPDGDWG